MGVLRKADYFQDLPQTNPQKQETCCCENVTCAYAASRNASSPAADIFL